MSFEYLHKDNSTETKWRALILFGSNTATYKFAFAKSLLELVDKETTRISLEDLAKPFALNIAKHLKESDKQIKGNVSAFLDEVKRFNSGEVNLDSLVKTTQKNGFKYVVDAFQHLHGGQISSPFYYKDFSVNNKGLIITDELLKLRESQQVFNLPLEVEARWKLVETAWNLNINPNVLEVIHDNEKHTFYIEENDFHRRIEITSSRDSLNGYQKGKCFYSFQDIDLCGNNVCHVDHFFPHSMKGLYYSNGVNINGVWNLVLADPDINTNKTNFIPEKRFLERLFNRNEFYIQSKHPLAETIINQTGQTQKQRIEFLNTCLSFFRVS
jgi:CRISPR/Cas system Type II protein with McrA/HNH and RuvC-like nuclease domain